MSPVDCNMPKLRTSKKVIFGCDDSSNESPSKSSSSISNSMASGYGNSGDQQSIAGSTALVGAGSPSHAGVISRSIPVHINYTNHHYSISIPSQFTFLEKLTEFFSVRDTEIISSSEQQGDMFYPEEAIYDVNFSFSLSN